jgi:hypothetical protein
MAMAKLGPIKLPIHLPDVPPARDGVEQRLDAILAELQYQRLLGLGPGSAIASAQDPDQPDEVVLREPLPLGRPKRGKSS